MSYVGWWCYSKMNTYTLRLGNYYSKALTENDIKDNDKR